MTSYLIPYRTNPFQNGFYSIGKESVLEEQNLALEVQPYNKKEGISSV